MPRNPVTDENREISEESLNALVLVVPPEERSAINRDYETLVYLLKVSYERMKAFSKEISEVVAGYIGELYYVLDEGTGGGRLDDGYWNAYTIMRRLERIDNSYSLKKLGGISYLRDCFRAVSASLDRFMRDAREVTEKIDDRFRRLRDDLAVSQMISKTRETPEEKIYDRSKKKALAGKISRGKVSKGELPEAVRFVIAAAREQANFLNELYSEFRYGTPSDYLVGDLSRWEKRIWSFKERARKVSERYTSTPIPGNARELLSDIRRVSEKFDEISEMCREAKERCVSLGRKMRDFSRNFGE